jgi:hypothetical protein
MPEEMGLWPQNSHRTACENKADITHLILALVPSATPAGLESGHSEVLTAYLGAMAKFHTYSFGNIMLIARQEARCYQRCRTSYMELAWPLR